MNDSTVRVSGSPANKAYCNVVIQIKPLELPDDVLLGEGDRLSTKTCEKMSLLSHLHGEE